MKAQQWKSKVQPGPLTLGDGIPSPPYRRKRRHSEPQLQDSTNTYKNFVTHWKLPPSNTLPLNTKITTNPKIISSNYDIFPLSNDTTQTTEIQLPQKQLPHTQPFVCKPSPVSPTSQSPHVTPPSPHSSELWKPEPFKSTFHPYKRDPQSPSTHKFSGTQDKRRNSAPHISYYGTNSASSLDNRLETIPELSFPPHLHPILTLTDSTTYNSQKQSYEFLQTSKCSPPDSVPVSFHNSANSDDNDIPKFARNTRRRMSVDNLLV